MFLLFVNLYYAMFSGTWSPWSSLQPPFQNTQNVISGIGTFLTSIFGDSNMTNLGDYWTYTNLITLTSVILAFITCIGIVVMAVKGIKRIFGVFFMFAR